MSSLWSQDIDDTKQDIGVVEDVNVDHPTNLGDLLAATGSQLPVWPTAKLEFDKHLGSGGTFEVSRELHVDHIDEKWTPYYVAVKRMRLDEDASAQHWKHYDCVVRELQIMTHPSLRDHANIICLLAYGWTSSALGRHPYLVVEYSDYGTLTDHLQRIEPDLNERRELALDVAVGLKALHDCKIIHGDLKPHDVLVFAAAANLATDRLQIAKLADFGGSVFEVGDVKRANYGGTSVYKAPELDGRGMYKGVKAVTRSQLYQADIYSFGLTVWEIFNNGTQYFEERWLKQGESPLDALRRICDEEVDGILSRARIFYKRLFGQQQPSVFHIALLKTFSMTLRDDAVERCSISRVIEGLAHGTDATSRPASSTVMSLPKPSETATHGTASLPVDSAPGDYVGPRLRVKYGRNKSFYHSSLSNRTWIENTDYDFFLQQHIPVSPEPNLEGNQSQQALTAYVKRPPSGLSQPYGNGIDFFHTAAAPNTPWEIQRDVFKHLQRTAQSLYSPLVNTASEHSQAFFQLAMCYHIGFGVRRDIKAMLQCLTNSLPGNYTSKAIYKRVVTALVPYLGPEVNHMNLDHGFMTKADVILDAHDNQDTYFAARISTYAHSRPMENSHWHSGISMHFSLAETVKSGDLSAVSHALSTRSFSARDVSIALCTACELGNASLTMLLCGHLECLDPDPAQPTPLHWLMMFDPEEIERVGFALVLGAGGHSAGPCKKFVDTMPAIGTDIFFLEEHCADFFGAPLHWAVRARNLQLVKLLIHLGANISIRWNGHDELYAGISRGVLPNFSPLDLAIAYHLPEIVELLLDAGANWYGSQFDSFTKSGRGAFDYIGLACTPLSRYIIHGANYREAMRNCIRVLVDRGYAISEKDSSGYDCLKIALRDCDCESYIIEELFSAGAPLTGSSLDDASNNVHITARNALDRRYNVSSLALVAPHVHDINGTTNSGRATIHYAAIGGSDAMVEIICNCIGSKVDAISSDGRGQSALQYAAIFGSVDVLRVLIHHGAEKEFRDHDGLTALQLAIIHRQKEAADMLLEVGAEFVYQSGSPRLCTALHAASGSNPVTSILRYLLETHPELRNPVVINSQDCITTVHMHAPRIAVQS